MTISSCLQLFQKEAFDQSRKVRLIPRRATLPCRVVYHVCLVIAQRLLLGSYKIQGRRNVYKGHGKQKT